MVSASGPSGSGSRLPCSSSSDSPPTSHHQFVALPVSAGYLQVTNKASSGCAMYGGKICGGDGGAGGNGSDGGRGGAGGAGLQLSFACMYHVVFIQRGMARQLVATSINGTRRGQSLLRRTRDAPAGPSTSRRPGHRRLEHASHTRTWWQRALQLRERFAVARAGCARSEPPAATAYSLVLFPASR